MAYLDPTHLIFSGDFLSDVSTVNNNPAHFNNATFQPSFQEYDSGGNNGMWNPEGGATFSLQRCTVKKIAMEGDASIAVPGDIVIGTRVEGASGRNTGKMVDLDPQQQGTSELWGVKFSLVNDKNELLLTGDIKNTAFRDLQTRQQTGGNVNGQPFGGTWTSVIENLIWGEPAHSSPFLVELKAKTQKNKLSINLNAYGYYYAHAPDGRFSLGRILGTIGPWYDHEPDTFSPCRRLYGIYQNPGTGFPIIFFSNSNFCFNRRLKKLTVDFGSSFPIADAMGSITLNEQLFLAVSKSPVNAGISATPLTIDNSAIEMIGKVNYEAGPNWLNDTGGLLSFDNLSDEAIELLENHQLLLLRLSASGQFMAIARETINGLVVRADNFVTRLDCGQVNQVQLYTYQYGQALKDATIQITLEPATPITPMGPGNPICEIPGNNYPPEGISFPATTKSDDNGRAVLELKGNKIISPRGYIDGQIYVLDYQFSANPPDPAIGPLANDNIFIHLRDYFEIPDTPKWSDIAATMIQFANLYPIMSRYLVNLGDPEALIAKRELLKFAFSRDIADPVYMPVTRDLSEAKRQTILKWLDHPIIQEPIALTETIQAESVTEAGLPGSPAQPDSPLTDNQQRLKNAVRAKNGAGFRPVNIDKIFND